MTSEITALQWSIYTAWLDHDKNYKKTAIALGRYPENIRQVVAKVLYKIDRGAVPPT